MNTPLTDALWTRLTLDGWMHDHKPVCYIMESHEQLERELEQERALADRLAEAMLINANEISAGDDLCWHPEHTSALAAWKEARDAIR